MMEGGFISFSCIKRCDNNQRAMYHRKPQMIIITEYIFCTGIIPTPPLAPCLTFKRETNELETTDTFGTVYLLPQRHNSGYVFWLQDWKLCQRVFVTIIMFFFSTYVFPCKCFDETLVIYTKKNTRSLRTDSILMMCNNEL